MNTIGKSNSVGEDVRVFNGGVGAWRRILAALWVIALSIAVLPGAHAWQADNGDGTFKNPVLYADYPDPAVVRVGGDFYMVSTTFADSPGITVLHSRDLVNWEIASHCATNLNWKAALDLNGGTAYQGGFWASTIAYRNGTFYIAANPVWGQNGRIYYATNAAGPWQYYQLNQGIYDPGIFIDTDGTGYIATGSDTQSILVLNSNYSQIISVSNNVVNSGGEGSHLVKHGSYYYLFNASSAQWPWRLYCSRATNIFGPWETGHIAVLITAGGGQGAIVDLDDTGTNWFAYCHHDEGKGYGRVPRFGPVFWENNWPVFGTPSARDSIADTVKKPVLGQPLMQPATSDDFTNSILGLQWQWNHNPDNTRWSLTERSGYLRLRPTMADNLWIARNTLTQKGQGPQSSGIVKLDLSNLQAGDVAGFGTFGKVCGDIEIRAGTGGNKTLTMHMIKDQVGSYSGPSAIISGNTLYLRTDMDFNNALGICSYSTDGAAWTTLGGNFELLWGYGSTFQGEKFALFYFNTNTASSAGYVDVDSFAFSTNAPLVTLQRGRPALNPARTTFVGDNGQLLRGPFTSTETNAAVPASQIATMQNLGFNAVHLYAETFDPNYPNAGSRAPGYAATNVDAIVAATRTNGLYLVITIGSGANSGSYNLAWATNFWKFYAPHYASETHVLYEIQSEPVAGGPSYPSGAINMETACYQIIRANAPNTPVLLFSYAALGSNSVSAAMNDIRAFNGAVFGNPNAVWTNEAVAFHGYGGWQATPAVVAGILSNGYPCFMTEFAAPDWGVGGNGLDVEQTSALENLGVSWLTFQHIPPIGVSDDVTVAANYQNRVDNGALVWTPDFGNWPVSPRGIYGNGGQARATTTNWVGNFLTDTLRIQAEDFDTGGNGVAYYNTHASNSGGQYRTNDTVGIETCSDTGGGYDVGWTSSGDWLEYTVLVSQSGFYNLALRYATPNSGCSVDFSANGNDKTGTWALPNTGGWQTWLAATQQVFLEFGRQKLHLAIPGGGVNFNWMELAPISTGPVTNGIYKFINQNSGLVMENNVSSNSVVQNVYVGAAIQQWNLQHVGAGQYKVTSAQNNYTWNVSAGSGNPLGLASSWNMASDSQRFIIRSNSAGSYRIAPAAGGMDLEVKGAATTGGAPVQQNLFTGATSQQWVVLATNSPGFPAGLSAYALTFATQVNLNWNALDGASSYNVKRSTTSGGSYTTIATGITLTNYTDANVVIGTQYYYVVSAMVGGTETLNSPEAGVTVRPIGEPVADSYVNDGSSADSNFGTSTGLTVKNSGGLNDGFNRITYLKFDVHGVNGAQNVKMLLTPYQVGGTASLAYELVTNDTWTETGITWNNQPGGSGVILTNISGYTVGVPVTVDVTGAAASQAASDGYLSVRVTEASGNNIRVDFASKEHPTNSWHPVLQLVTPTNTLPTCYVNTSSNLQVIDGFGFSTAWCGQLSSAKNNALYGTLGMSLLRVRIDENGNWGYETSNSVAAHAAGVKVFGSPWSPPPAWNSNGSATGGYLLPSHYGDYVNWLNSAASSIGLDYVSVQNEPDNTAFCVWSPDQMHTFVRDYAGGLTRPVIMPEAIGFNDIMADPVINDPVAVNNFEIYGGHLYSHGPSVKTNALAHAKSVWMTEHFINGENTMSASVAIAQEISDCMNDQMSAYVWWWVNDGDTNMNLALSNGTINKNGYTIGQFAKWVRPGMVRCGTTYNPTNGVFVTAYRGATNGIVIVALNTNTAPVSQTFTIQNATNVSLFSVYRTSDSESMTNLAGISVTTNTFSCTLPAQSVTTFVQFLGTVPVAPASLNATIASSGQISLNWSPVTNAASYSIKRSTTNGGPYTTVASGVSGTNYTDTAYYTGATYYYVVSAVNAGGESANSPQAGATTPASLNIEPVADAYVNDGGSANNNYGTFTNLTVKSFSGINSGYNRIAYFKFDVHALANARSAKLILTPCQVGGNIPLAYEWVTNDNWTELGITWNNQPGGSGVFFTNLAGYTLNVPVTVNVTAAAISQATNDGYLSLRVTDTNFNNVRMDFYSKEWPNSSYHPVLQVTNSIPINTAPVLAAITNRTIGVGVTMSITNVATDSDVPAQTLTFSLLTAPISASINSSSGVLTWRPLTTQANSTNPFTVMVADNGTPSLSATQSFGVTVPPLTQPQVSTPSLSGNQLVLRINGASGPDYQIQASSNLVNWSAIFTTNAPPVPFAWTNSISNGPPMNFFRVLMGPPF